MSLHNFNLHNENYVSCSFLDILDIFRYFLGEPVTFIIHIPEHVSIKIKMMLFITKVSIYSRNYFLLGV